MKPCILCGTRSKKRQYLTYVYSKSPYREFEICYVCWDRANGNVKPRIQKKLEEKT